MWRVFNHNSSKIFGFFTPICLAKWFPLLTGILVKRADQPPRLCHVSWRECTPLKQKVVYLAGSQQSFHGPRLVYSTKTWFATRTKSFCCSCRHPKPGICPCNKLMQLLVASTRHKLLKRLSKNQWWLDMTPALHVPEASQRWQLAVSLMRPCRYLEDGSHCQKSSNALLKNKVSRMKNSSLFARSWITW